MDRDLPRTRRTAALAATIAGIAVMCIPFGYLYPRVPITETWALVLPEILTRKVALGGWDVQILIVVGTAIALLIFGIVKRPAAAVIAPIVVVAFFAVTQAAVVHSIGKSSASYRSAVGVGDAAGWIDRLVPRGTDIAVLLGSPAGPDADRDYLWQTQFFNRAPLAAASWGKELLTDPLTGAVTSPTGSPVPLPPFVVTPASQRLQGDVVAANGAFLLIRPANPAALAALATGFLGDGWIAPQAAVSWFGNTGTGTVHVHLDRAFVPASIGPATATVTVGPLVAAADGSPSVPPGSPTQTAQISTTQAADLAFDAPKAPFRVTITIDPGYRPSDVGQADTRELGARASVAIDDQVIAQ